MRCAGFAVEDWASAGTAIMGVPTVMQARTWVGLDVHAAKVVAAIADAKSGELRVQRLPGRTSTVVEFCAALPGPVRVSYEAGPTGFGLARALERRRRVCDCGAGQDRSAGERSREDRSPRR
jgi:hypothetical protein